MPTSLQELRSSFIAECTDLCNKIRYFLLFQLCGLLQNRRRHSCLVTDLAEHLAFSVSGVQICI